jgi:hypothetical protein
MARIVITAQVEDSSSWEEKFRTHGDLFREQTITDIHFSISDDNEVAVYFELDDLEKCMEILNAPVTAEAMETDGVKRETVKIYVLDGQFAL